MDGESVAAPSLIAHDPTVVDHDHATVELVDHRLVMRGQEDDGPRPVDPFEEVDHLPRVLWIEVAGRLVSNENPRGVDEGPRDRRSLSLTATELVGVQPGSLGKTDQGEDPRDPRGDLGAGHVAHFEREGDILAHGLVRQEPEILEDNADFAPVVRQIGWSELGDVAVDDSDRTVARLLLGDQESNQRRFAGAARADNRDELTGVDGEVYVAKRYDRLRVATLRQVLFADILKLNQTIPLVITAAVVTIVAEPTQFDERTGRPRTCCAISSAPTSEALEPSGALTAAIASSRFIGTTASVSSASGLSSGSATSPWPR